MKNWIYLLVFIPISVFGQVDNCDQYKKMIEYLKSDSASSSYYKVNFKLKINDRVGKGGIFPIMTYEYIAGKLGLDNKKMVFAKDTAIVHSMARQLTNDDYSDTTTIILSCLSSFGIKKKGNINVRFYIKDEKVFTMYTERVYNKPRHTNGMVYLFFFNAKNEIEKVFKSTWTE